MRSVPKFLRVGFRNALRVAIQEALSVDLRRTERGWKLLLMLPRMLASLQTSAQRGGFQREVIGEGRDVSRRTMATIDVDSVRFAEELAQLNSRRSRRGGTSIHPRAERALRLVQLGELSSARQALEGAEVASGDRNTLAALRDPVRRTTIPRDPLPVDLLTHVPMREFESGQRKVQQEFEVSSERRCSRAFGDDSGTFPTTLGPPISATFDVSSRREVGQSRCSSVDRGHNPTRKTHSPPEAEWRCEGHSRWTCDSESCGPHSCSTIGSSSGRSHSTLPIRALNQGRLGMCLPRGAGVDGGRPRNHSCVIPRSKRFRLDLLGSHAQRSVARGRMRCSAPICKTLLRQTFAVVLGGCHRHHSHRASGRGRGARRSLDALVVLSGSTQGTGGDQQRTVGVPKIARVRYH